MADYIIRETDDFLALSTLFSENGMGVEIEENPPERVIKMWRMDEPGTGRLMAATTLDLRDGVYALGGIAVRGDLQGKGYGKVMQDIVFDEARSRNISELWACAKVPAYYLRCGWEAMDWDTSPKIAVYCDSCKKRGTVCAPQIMRYKL